MGHLIVAQNIPKTISCHDEDIIFLNVMQSEVKYIHLRNAGEEGLDFNVGVDDLELMIPQASGDSQSPQQASLAPNKAKQD